MYDCVKTAAYIHWDVMGRRKNKWPPRLLRHPDGRAYCYVNRKPVYFGRHGPSAVEKYREFCMAFSFKVGDTVFLVGHPEMEFVAKAEVVEIGEYLGKWDIFLRRHDGKLLRVRPDQVHADKASAVDAGRKIIADSRRKADEFERFLATYGVARDQE